jgi:hypothetical protein
MTDPASGSPDAPQRPLGPLRAAPAASERELPEDPTTPGSASPPTGLDAAGRPWPPFAHGSEAEMARILDFYAVRWEYEPRTFPILWNLDGDVVESFSPDFYLPDVDLYLEMTTLKQRLVRKKNRKLRRLRELYPDIRIKLFYARDFRAMMLKYGRLALANSLSGTLGQVMSERLRDDEAVPLDEAIAGGSETALPALDEDAQASSPAPAPGASSGASPEAAPAPEAAPEARPAGLPSTPPAGTAIEAGQRRNGSRSRRRRAAAAARRASRAGEPATAVVGPTRRQDEEDQSRR